MQGFSSEPERVAGWERCRLGAWRRHGVKRARLAARVSRDRLCETGRAPGSAKFQRLDNLRILRKYIRNMRMDSTLSALFGPTRQAVLATTYLRPEKPWYLSELAAHLETRPSSLQRDVESLVRAGILEKRVDGRRSYIQANRESPVFEEIRSLMEKTSGIVPRLQKAIDRFAGKIEWAFLYGSFARGQEGARSDVDLMLIGNVSMMEMVSALQRVEKSVGREINPTIYTREEFLKNVGQKNHFLLTVMSAGKIMLKGRADELEEIARGA